MSFEIRDARESDAPAITAIYNASIRTTATWSDADQTVDQRRLWLAARRAVGDGVLVAAEGASVVGFAAYGEFRDNAKWPGYRFTVENTVHVVDSAQGRGIGKALMEALVEHAAAGGKHAMIAAVDSENPYSIEFHERLGFVEVGRLPEIGKKFDRWLDLVLLLRHL